MGILERGGDQSPDLRSSATSVDRLDGVRGRLATFRLRHPPWVPGSSGMNLLRWRTWSFWVRAFLAIVCGFDAPGSRGAEAGLSPVDLRCESVASPQGVDEVQPRLSWRAEGSRRGARQSAWRVLVASSQELLAGDHGDLWDSGRRAEGDGMQVGYAGRSLATGQRAVWKVRLWDEQGGESGWSTNAVWTAGVLAPADWEATWIGAPSGWTQGLPIFRRGFVTAQPVRRAVVHVTGLGHYELFLDGVKVGDRFLEPAWTVYEKTVGYSTYDVTQALQAAGPHVFAAMLGKGFYRTHGDRRIHGVDSDRPLQLLLQAQLEFADGSVQSIGSDDTWRVAEGPITHSAILGGEDYDARRLPLDWAQPGFDDADWAVAIPTEGPGGRLTHLASPPMQVRAVLPVVRIDEPEPGVFVYDFGQNASAIPRLTVRGRAGQRLRLTPAEQRRGMSPRRNDGRGRVDPAGVGRPCYFEYTLRGSSGPETWAPQFTYTGFQYLEMEGAVPAGHANPGGLPEVLLLESLHVRSAAEEQGDFACSDPRLNGIDRMITWAVRANLAHVLTDCPHREKLGWLEVAYLMGPSIAGRHDLSGLYAKVVQDCMDSQGVDGRIPTVAPAYPAFSGGFAYTPEWGAAAVLIPQLLHTWYGDRRTLERAYPSMRAFVDFMERTAHDHVPVAGLGDWYDYGHGKPVGASQFTPVELSAMATLHRCTRVVAWAARELGRTEEADHYQRLADEVASAFQRHWFNGVDEYRNQGSPQTANAMALVSGLVPAERTGPVLDAVVRDLQRRGWQQTAGDIGHWYLLEALGNAGRSEIIHAMATRTNLGSYGFILQNGWTSMPEAWDADTGASMNHCMLGHLQEWLLGRVAGIRPDPDGPGFARFLVAPEVVGDLTWASGRIGTVRGPIRVRWEEYRSRFRLEVTVPANTEARIRIPTDRVDAITEQGKPLREGVEGVREVSHGDGVTWVRVGGGQYRFESGTSSDPGPVPTGGPGQERR